MVSKKMKNMVLLAFAGVPLCWSLALLTFVLRSRNYLGYWPTPYNPDPKVLPFPVHYSLVFVGIHFVLGTLPTLVGIRLLPNDVASASTWRSVTRITAMGWGLLLLMAFQPPINFVAWFLD